MSTRLVNVDRRTPLLLPPDLRDGIPQDDMVNFVIEAIEGMPLGKLRVNERGTGSEQYPPRMLLALVVYCYANGLFGSRRIERAGELIEELKQEVNEPQNGHCITQGRNAPWSEARNLASRS